MKVPLDAVERQIARLWEAEAERSGAPRIEIMTLVALASEPALLGRAQAVVAEFVRMHPSRTIVAYALPGSAPAVLADVELHRREPGAPAVGDALVLEATGAAREWLPENVDRLVLSGLPVCLWWIGDLPDFDRLFDRMLLSANQVVVNTAEMDLRDLQKLSELAQLPQARYAISDLAWIRLRPLQKLIARFFDDEAGRARLTRVRRVGIEFAPRARELDVSSPEGGLLFGWIARALGLRAEGVRWRRGDTWAEASLGEVTVRFERGARVDVPAGAILRVAIECEDARFVVERQTDPAVFRWARDVPSAPLPEETFRCPIHEEAELLARCLERPRRDPLFEASLHLGSRIVRPVAPRLSRLPAALD